MSRYFGRYWANNCLREISSFNLKKALKKTKMYKPIQIYLVYNRIVQNIVDFIISCIKMTTLRTNQTFDRRDITTTVTH